MSNEGSQHRIGRNRPPRVHITYDVEVGDAIRKYELNYLVGVLGDLFGERYEVRSKLLRARIAEQRAALVAEQELSEAEAARLVPDRELDDAHSVKDRRFIDVDKISFDALMERLLPAVRVSADTTIVFTELADFEPHRIVEQVPELRRLKAARDKLRDLSGALDGNDDLHEKVEQIMAELPRELVDELTGSPAPEHSPTTPTDDEL